MTYTWRQSVAGIEMAALLCQSPAAAQSAEKAAPAAESSAAATSADQTLREELETLKQRLEQLGKLLSVKEANSTQDEASSVAKSEDRTSPEAAPAGGVSPRLVDDAVLLARLHGRSGP
jgi:hypothetical protein